MVDIDGVISLFGFRRPDSSGRSTPGTSAGSFHTIDGIPHFLSLAAAAHLQTLAADFDLVWASGWEEKAEEYLPRLLDLPAGLPFLRFERSATGRWQRALEAGSDRGVAGTRALAWIDDAFNAACHAWAATRPAPTLLVQTAPERGLTSGETQLLARLGAGAGGAGNQPASAALAATLRRPPWPARHAALSRSRLEAPRHAHTRRIVPCR